MVLKFQHLLPANSSFLLLGEVVEELISPHDDSSSLDSFAVSSYWLHYPDIPLAACHRLLNLPQLLKEALPAIPFEEMTIVIPAISCLTKSYARSYASDNGLALWNGIEAWVLQLSDEFQPAILISNSVEFKRRGIAVNSTTWIQSITYRRRPITCSLKRNTINADTSHTH